MRPGATYAEFNSKTFNHVLRKILCLARGARPPVCSKPKREQSSARLVFSWLAPAGESPAPFERRGISLWYVWGHVRICVTGSASRRLEKGIRWVLRQGSGPLLRCIVCVGECSPAPCPCCCRAVEARCLGLCTCAKDSPLDLAVGTIVRVVRSVGGFALPMVSPSFQGHSCRPSCADRREINLPKVTPRPSLPTEYYLGPKPPLHPPPSSLTPQSSQPAFEQPPPPTYHAFHPSLPLF